MIKVIKRDCTEVDFQKEKISNAILKAMKNGSGIVKPKIAEDIADEIYEESKDKEEISISEIESLVWMPWDICCKNQPCHTLRCAHGPQILRHTEGNSCAFPYPHPM